MNDEQIIAEICRKCGFNFTIGDLDALVKLCRQYYINRAFAEANNHYHGKQEYEKVKETAA